MGASLWHQIQVYRQHRQQRRNWTSSSAAQPAFFEMAAVVAADVQGCPSMRVLFFYKAKKSSYLLKLS